MSPYRDRLDNLTLEEATQYISHKEMSGLLSEDSTEEDRRTFTLCQKLYGKGIGSRLWVMLRYSDQFRADDFMHLRKKHSCGESASPSPPEITEERRGEFYHLTMDSLISKEQLLFILHSFRNLFGHMFGDLSSMVGKHEHARDLLKRCENLYSEREILQEDLGRIE